MMELIETSLTQRLKPEAVPTRFNFSHKDKVPNEGNENILGEQIRKATGTKTASKKNAGTAAGRTFAKRVGQEVYLAQRFIENPTISL